MRFFFSTDIRTGSHETVYMSSPHKYIILWQIETIEYVAYTYSLAYYIAVYSCLIFSSSLGLILPGAMSF